MPKPLTNPEIHVTYTLFSHTFYLFKKMTIREIAKIAGVSTATVSRFINENGFVGKEAKNKILIAFKQTGYDPEKRKRRTPQARNSGLKHKNFVMIWTAPHSEQSTTGQNIMMGISKILQNLDATLTVAQLFDHDEIPATLLKNQIDGILITGPAPSPAVCKQLQKWPVVWLLQAGSHDFGDRVQSDHGFESELAHKYLTDQGCRQLCCMSFTSTSKGHSSYWKTRENHFLNLSKEAQIQTSLITCPELNELPLSQFNLAEAVSRLVDKLLKLTPLPDGLYVTNWLGPYIHQELVKNGITPMKDLLMVAADPGIPTLRYLTPEMVTTRLSGAELGEQAVEILLQRIKKTDMPRITCMLKPNLLIPVT